MNRIPRWNRNEEYLSSYPSTDSLPSDHLPAPDSLHNLSLLSSIPSLDQPKLALASSSRPSARQLDIFPPGVGSISKGVTRSPYTFPSHYLYDIFTHNRGNQHVERTVVKSAWYGKQVKSAKHEFIVIHVEDPSIPGLQNCIAIDRSLGEASDTAMASSTGIASDTFRVSYDGDLKLLLKECHLSPYLELEHLSFLPNEPLLLQNLVALVHYISSEHPDYNLVNTNRNWFTGLVWACMLRMCPTAEHEVITPGKKGKFLYGCILPNPAQVAQVVQGVTNEIQMWSPQPATPNYHADAPWRISPP